MVPTQEGQLLRTAEQKPQELQELENLPVEKKKQPPKAQLEAGCLPTDLLACEKPMAAGCRFCHLGD